MPVRVLVVDDDALSREVFALLLQDAGYVIETADSGDAALLHLQSAHPRPEVVLADLQMPGTAGRELALQLRSLCGPATILLAMSASEPDDASGQAFDGLLLKPFTMETFAAAVAGRKTSGAQKSTSTGAPILDEAVYRKLAASMRPPQLEKLYCPLPERC